MSLSILFMQITRHILFHETVAVIVVHYIIFSSLVKPIRIAVTLCLFNLTQRFPDILTCNFSPPHNSIL